MFAKIMFRLYCVILVVCLCLSLVLGMPDGAPLEACSSMTPKHATNLAKSLDTAVHDLQVMKLNNNNNNIEYQVTLAGKTGSEMFRGFFVQARSTQGGSNQQAIGSWDITQAGHLAKLDACTSGNTASAVTHADNSNKNRIILKWIPPTGFSGNVAFLATVVENFQNFWVGIQSEMVSVGSNMVNNNNNMINTNSNNNNNVVTPSGIMTPNNNNNNNNIILPASTGNDVHNNVNSIKPGGTGVSTHTAGTSESNGRHSTNSNSNFNPNNSNENHNTTNNNNNNINTNTRSGNSKILEGAFGNNSSGTHGMSNSKNSNGKTVNSEGGHSPTGSAPKQAPHPTPKSLSGKGGVAKSSKSSNSTSAKSGVISSSQISQAFTIFALLCLMKFV